MAAAASNLEILIGRDLPFDNCTLIFASTDRYGNPGPLNSSVLDKLGMSLKDLSAVAGELEEGHAVLRTPSSRLLAFVVTVGKGNSEELLRGNLLSVFRMRSDVASSVAAWMPLMGIGSAGLDIMTSLHITLGAIAEGYASGNLTWRRLSLSIGRDVGNEALEGVHGQVARFFADGPVAATVTLVRDAPSGESPSEPPRGYNDDLPTQVDAPPVEPKLHFGEIADAIVAVVEDVVGSDARSELTTVARRREWLTAADARLTVGIFAPWGAGKSTLINALRERFLGQGYPVFAVNAWKWDGKGDLHDHVRATVIFQAGRQGRARGLLAWLKLRTFWRNYGARVLLFAFIAALLLVFGRPLAEIFQQMSDGKATGSNLAGKTSPDWNAAIIFGLLAGSYKLVGGWLNKQIEARLFSSVPDKLGADGLSLVYRDIATLIGRKQPPRPFVFVFDDLDRCIPERVAAVLESVHSLTAAGCVVFLACDDEYVVAALNAHYDKVARVYGDGKIFGQRYLEKIVHITFRLPLLKNTDIFELGIATLPRARPASGPLVAPLSPDQPMVATPREGPTAPAPVAPSPGTAQIPSAKLQEIIGDLMGQAVEPLGLNVRQAKSVANTLKLYLRIQNCRMEADARQLAAFVFADRFDQRWLDGQYHGVQVLDSPVGAVSDLASRLAAMIGDDKTAMLRMYHLLGRRPGLKPTPTREATAAPK